MDDRSKTKEQLIEELAGMRKRLAELEHGSVSDSEQALGNDVFEHHLDVVLYIDALNGDILWSNRAAAAFYGYSRDELSGMHITNINIMERAEVAARIKQVRERTRSRFLFVHRLKSGEVRNVEVYAVPFEIRGRQMICSFIRDVTGAADSEVSVETNAAMQDIVLSTMNIVPFFLRNEPGYEPLYVGGSVAKVTGFPPEKFYGDSMFWPSRIHEDDRERVVGRFRRIGNTGSTRCEYRWKVEDGTYRWFALSMRLAPCGMAMGEDGESSCLAGLFWDITERKRTEQALIKREERYRTVADFTFDWVFWIGPDGGFLYVSPSFERVTGYRPDALQRNPELLFDTIVHPQDRELVRSCLLDGLLSPELLQFDFRIVTRDGDVRWIGHASQPVYDDKGDPLGRRASNRDITELKATMQTLKEKNQFISSMMDNSPATIYAKDVDGRYLFGNMRFLEYVGKPPSEVLGKTDFGLFDNARAERLRESDRRVLETGEPLFEEIQMLRKGVVEHWTSSKFPLLNADGDVLGVCGISLDVTKWREAEADLRRLTRAVEQSPVSIAMTDTDGIILSVNPYFREASGYDEQEILGRKLGFMLVEGEENSYDEAWRELRVGGDWHGEVRNRTKGGDALWESTSISPVRDSQGTITNYVVVKDDITERVRLQRLERDVERIVRHDLKSPIMSFIWVPRSLRKAVNITEEQAVMLAELEESAHRLLKMVNMSLDLFKMEEGTYTFQPEDLNVIRVIHNVLRDVAKTIRAMKVDVSITIDGAPASEKDCMLLRGEELLFHSMLSNLIKNAVEASPRGAVVTIDCRSEDVASISIHNEGEVAEPIRDRFFEKYATHGKKFGTGLGTYSARLIAETQGGTISMRTSPAAGTVVEVRFPVKPACPMDA